ncbi:MAG TPA: DMT family transporter [Hyphomicrobiales bacterium]|nr:DMT family transporter [Hyphomicrobiales bacterium]
MSARSANLQGILWMVAAMAAFAVEDALIKRAAREMPIGEVLIVFGLGGALAFLVLAYRDAAMLLRLQSLSRLMLVRMVFELVGRLFYFLAVALTPLSAATAILQATPVLVVLGAGLYFGERVGWRRWLAVIAGLIGVLIVLRPSAADFSALSMLTVVGMIGFAGRDLASRAAPPSLGARHLGFYGFLTVALAGMLYAAWEGRAFVQPNGIAAACLAGAVVVGVFAYASLMKAMRSGDVATVTPFRYTRLLFGIGLGVVLFGERIDAPMVIGCAVIVASGLLIAWQGRVTVRQR